MRLLKWNITAILIASFGQVCLGSVDADVDKFKAALDRHEEKLERLAQDEDFQLGLLLRDYEISIKTVRLMDIRDEKHYTGAYTVGPQLANEMIDMPEDPNEAEMEAYLNHAFSPENVICFRPEFNEHFVFWAVGEEIRRKALKEFVYRTILDLPRERLLVFTMKGIIALSLDGTDKEQWLWRLPDRDDALMYYIKQKGFDINRPCFVFTVIQGSNPCREMLAAWGSTSNKISQFDINSSPDEVVWAGNERIVISIEDKLVRATFSPDGNCEFSEEKVPQSGWILVAACEEELVWLKTNRDSYVTQLLRIGNITMPWTDDRAFSLIDAGGYVYGVGDDLPDEEENGQQRLVFKLNRKGDVTIVDSWDLKDMDIYASGAAGETFWVASEDGQVRTYGDKQDAFRVQLPRQTYGKHKLIELLGDNDEWKSWSDVLPEFKK